MMRTRPCALCGEPTTTRSGPARCDACEEFRQRLEDNRRGTGYGSDHSTGRQPDPNVNSRVW